MSNSPRKENAPHLPKLLALLFMLAVAVGLGVLLWTVASQSYSASQRQQRNVRAGLPADFPSDAFPLYLGAALLSSSKGEVKSTDGAPMDQWSLHAESDDEIAVVYEFYNSWLLKAGMAQTLYAAVPSGYGVTYADERSEIKLTVERKKSDKKTQIEVTISRLR